ncbi:hypothetical protein FOMPIDRAFT_69174 [Fomitopsis schrenkii]|uniref:Uncharacterized protein n=1 Tax=Fomitopsis schrenkii TaxID=2126942 RepID=S8EQI7_FOMSC|nr:hypothetical protein FOMPIDRAFT_69174 [Fomitopsis schrenkii]
MGGNAFNQTLPQASFPRMPPATYKALKATLLPLVEQFYDLVAVPPEAPEKPDHGDLDFVVAYPHSDDGADCVKAAIRAAHYLPQEGRGTSSFAIPVDVNVCADRESWERTLFLHSYGDTGMILGVIGRSAGVALGVHGLKFITPLPTNPPISFQLSTSLPHILEFYSLSQSRLDDGFVTQRELFEWVATSRLFNAQSVAPAEQSHNRGKKRRSPRAMYQSFLEYARERADDPAYAPPTETVTQDDVLRFFGKEAEHAALIRASRVKQNAREVFSGKVVEGWIGMKGLPVKWVLDVARERLNEQHEREHPAGGGEQSRQPGHEAEAALLSIAPWEFALFDMTAKKVQQFVVDVKAEMEASGTFEVKWQEEDARKADKRKMKAEQ